MRPAMACFEEKRLAIESKIEEWFSRAWFSNLWILLRFTLLEVEL
jgi:hypothetical protein